MSLYKGAIYFSVNHELVCSRTLLSTVAKEFPITMAAIKLCIICLFLCLIGIASADSANKLRPDFYNLQCPLALQTIKEEVTTALRKDPTMGLILYSLHFIDCFLQASLHFPQLLCITFENSAYKYAFCIQYPSRYIQN